MQDHGHRGEPLISLLLERLAAMLGKTPGEPGLKEMLEDVVVQVLEYCNLRTLPRGLHAVVLRMARDAWLAEGYGATAQEAQPQAVSSIRRGDVTISYATAGAEAYAARGWAGLLAAYATDLAQYRKLRW